MWEKLAVKHNWKEKQFKEKKFKNVTYNSYFHLRAIT